MDTRLTDVLNNSEANYLLPFYWQVGRHTEELRSQLGEIYSCGIKAVCLESRTHSDFCGDGWWEDMGIILDECRKLGMKVWILDDDHFPTGHANGLIPKKYPERRKWQLVERHIDALGPMTEASFIVGGVSGEDELIGAFAYRRTNAGEEIESAAIDLSGNIKNGFLFWDVPDGCWRIFYLIKTRRGTNQTDYISLIDPESVDVLIEAVYAPHYEHFAGYFGNTIAGFFSDEPSFGNTYSGGHIGDRGFYDKRVGMPGLALPWNGKIVGMMSDELGFDAKSFLPALWYDMGGIEKSVRYAYMNAVTKLYRDNFTRRLGDWCRAHGVMYIGHIIEDMNAHARLGCSSGHYFRSLTGQDMGGIDIVLHQVMPGFADYITASVCAGGLADPEFYHYVLAKLASSLAHIDKNMEGRAMCEVFGAFGWAESVPFMKWLIDFLLVRGVNHFVPHAFSQTFPNPDCPPHFGAGGEDPQFEGFRTLMLYTNKAAHLLSGATHIADAAILYHAEAEWMNGDGCMFTQKPAKALFDDKIDYDIIPIDSLMGASIEDGKLRINDESYGCLIIPYAAELPETFYDAAARFVERGLPVWFVDKAPDNCKIKAEVIPLGELAAEMRSRGLTSISVDGESELLRIYHCRRNDTDVYMFFNESLTRETHARVKLPSAGKYTSLDLLGDESYSGETNGEIELSLKPYQSEIIVFGESFLPGKYELTELNTPELEYRISIADSTDMNNFRPYKTTRELKSMTGISVMPDFSGRIKYETEFETDNPDGLVLDLGNVGEIAAVSVNGSSPKELICQPYRTDISAASKCGKNTLEIVVSNTLAHRMKDNMSTYMQLPPSGLLGPVKLYQIMKHSC